MRSSLALLLSFAITPSLLQTLPAAADDRPRPKPIARWKLEADARDSSGNGRDGIAENVEFLKASDADPKPSARFNGRNSSIIVPADRSPNLGGGEFSIFARIRVDENSTDRLGDVLACYDPDARRGFTLGFLSASGVTTSQANDRQLHFGIDDGLIEPNWTDLGRLGNAVYVMGMTVYEGSLFASTCEAGASETGRVFRLDDARGWIDCKIPVKCNAVASLAVHQGRLYAGSAKYRLKGSALPESENVTLGGSVYRYEEDGRWTEVGKFTGVEAVHSLVSFGGKLYASSIYSPGFFRYEGGTSWTSLPLPEGKRVECLGVHDGEIYATSYDGGLVYRYDPAKGWTRAGVLGDNTQTYSFAVLGGKLHCGTWPSGRVYRMETQGQWTDLGRLGEEREVMGTAVHNGKLYAGTLPLAHVFRLDGPDRWTDVGRVDLTPSVTYRRAWSMAQYRGRLYCGTLPSGRVLSIEAGRNVTIDRAIDSSWHTIAAVRSKDRLRLYLDGKLAATSAAIPSDRSLNLTSGKPLTIGRGPADDFLGRLRDVRIYDKALDAQDLESILAEE